MKAWLAAVSLLALAACGGKEEAKGPVSGPEPSVEMPGGPKAELIPVTAADTLTLTCAAPFTPDATAATLAQVFGAANVIPETRDGPEGEKLNVTAIYPQDKSRRIEVMFANEEERSGLTSVTFRGETSQWTGAGGINLGDGIGTIERLNGGPFTLFGFGWDYGGHVNDWKGGKLSETVPGCRTSVRFSIPEGAGADAILGENEHSSDEPAIRAASPFVDEISIHWAKPQP